MSKTTRSTFEIDAVAHAAAQAAPAAFPPGQKVNLLAGLAGFVLRFFRRSSSKDAARMNEPCPNQCQLQTARPPGRRLGPPRPRSLAAPELTGARKGGPRHG